MNHQIQNNLSPLTYPTNAYTHISKESRRLGKVTAAVGFYDV
ncbi:MAG TPA: hypothetical protein VD815_06230 [Candidatus Saccharimonadales bacterium]|nr:hypothetical protein [Candidatus Saccharimonadales bacterium]